MFHKDSINKEARYHSTRKSLKLVLKTTLKRNYSIDTMSLHWILLLTVTLLHCLTAAPITKDKEVNVKYDDIKDLIEELKEMGCVSILL